MVGIFSNMNLEKKVPWMALCTMSVVFMLIRNQILPTQQMTIWEMKIFFSQELGLNPNYTLIIDTIWGRYFYIIISPSKIFFVTFFSATIDDRNQIFGHKLHIVGSVFGPIRFLLPVCRLC